MSVRTRISKDEDLDVAYVELRKGSVATTVELRPGILFDLDKNGQVIGIEILAVSQLAPSLKGSSQGTTKRQRSAS